MTPDLRGFLAAYERENPKEFCRIHREVDPKYEVAAILTKLEEARKLPILFYEKVKGSGLPVVTNVYSTRKKIAVSLGVDGRNLRDKYIEAMENPIPPQVVSDGPVMEETLTEDEVDLRTFPLMTYHESDAAPYMTAGMVLAEDPETGKHNASFNRLMYQGRNRAGIFMTVGKHLHEIYSRKEEQGEGLPISISLGNHPAWALGALYIGPYGDDELGIIGGLMGQAAELVRGRLPGVLLPAHAEIVLEAVIEPHIREEEGPFCEFSGYATGKGPRPVVTIKSVHLRSKAILPGYLWWPAPGAPGDGHDSHGIQPLPVHQGGRTHAGGRPCTGAFLPDRLHQEALPRTGPSGHDGGLCLGDVSEARHRRG